MNQFLKKKKENKDTKPSAATLFDDSSKNKEKTSKNNEGWSDEDDDYNVDIKIAEKKDTDGKKPAVVNISSAGWKDEPVETKPAEPVKDVKRWGDSIATTNNIEKEFFPTLSDAYK